MKATSRRAYLKQLGLALAASALPSPTIFAEEPKPTEKELAALAQIAHNLVDKHDDAGLSVAIARHGQMVYQCGFGYAEKASFEHVRPASLFRIASVTKPITSAAIFTLIEQGKLRLDELVFGEQGVLKFDYGDKYPERAKKLTLHHLLTHTGGGWTNDIRDPMFHEPHWNHRQLITWTLREQPLEHEPGTHYAYSNFGYCILGRVIEKVTGRPYAEFVQKEVLAKCGVTDMRIAGNTLAEQAPGEVVYYGQPNWKVKPYDMNVARMDSHGGWIGTPGDIVRFAMHVDGFRTTPNILSAGSIKAMTTGTSANPNYACGWQVNDTPNWWHTGNLPGNMSIPGDDAYLPGRAGRGAGCAASGESGSSPSPHTHQDQHGGSGGDWIGPEDKVFWGNAFASSGAAVARGRFQSVTHERVRRDGRRMGCVGR